MRNTPTSKRHDKYTNHHIIQSAYIHIVCLVLNVTAAIRVLIKYIPNHTYSKPPYNYTDYSHT